MIVFILVGLALYTVSVIAVEIERHAHRDSDFVDRTPEIEQFEERFKRTRGYL